MQAMHEERGSSEGVIEIINTKPYKPKKLHPGTRCSGCMWYLALQSKVGEGGKGEREEKGEGENERRNKNVIEIINTKPYKPKKLHAGTSIVDACGIWLFRARKGEREERREREKGAKIGSKHE
jgi:hypothetical protein